MKNILLNLYREVARAYNLLDVAILENVLSEDICYSSQNVLPSLNGKFEVLKYLTEKFQTVRNSDNPVFAELGYMKSQEGWTVQLGDVEKGDPCLILSQGSKENKGAVILLGVPLCYRCCRPTGRRRKLPDVGRAHLRRGRRHRISRARLDVDGAGPPCERARVQFRHQADPPGGVPVRDLCRARNERRRQDRGRAARRRDPLRVRHGTIPHVHTVDHSCGQLCLD